MSYHQTSHPPLKKLLGGLHFWFYFDLFGAALSALSYAINAVTKDRNLPFWVHPSCPISETIRAYHKSKKQFPARMLEELLSRWANVLQTNMNNNALSDNLKNFGKMILKVGNLSGDLLVRNSRLVSTYRVSVCLIAL